MEHETAAAFLGAYALDALTPDERFAVHAHLDQCDECRTELRRYAPIVRLLDEPDG